MEAPKEEEKECVGRGGEATMATVGGGRKLGEVSDDDGNGRTREGRQWRQREKEGEEGNGSGGEKGRIVQGWKKRREREDNKGMRERRPLDFHSMVLIRYLQKNFL